MVKRLILLFCLLALVGCAEIKPLQLPQYYPPDFSKLKRPDIPVPEEGKDYVIDEANGRVIYTLSGQNLLAAEVISEKTAWAIVDMLKQILDIQTEMIWQKDQLIVTIDLQRQYAEKGKTNAEVKAIISEVVALISIALRFIK